MERRTRERRRRDAPVAVDRRWLPQRRRGARRGGLLERLHRYSN